GVQPDDALLAAQAGNSAVTPAANLQAQAAPDPWQQIAGATPCLQAHVECHQHQYRGRTWYVVANKLAATYFRCDAFAHEFIRCLDGFTTVADAYQTCSDYAACANNQPGQASPVPDQGDIIRLLGALREADMLQGMDDDSAGKQAAAKKQAAWLMALMRPLAIKLPLLDPDTWLQKISPACNALFTPLAFALWAALVACAVLTTASHWPELGLHWDARFLDWKNALWLWLLYPLIKGAHELGHGIAARRWGGEVHEMRVMLLVFMPVPYVDASSSSTLSNKHQRMLVAAAGIIVELLLASVALLAWAQLEPGTLRDIAFNIAFIAGASTLLFNGNPLLKFDGYYVMTDAIEIPNLGTRANQYLGYLIKRYAFGLANMQSPASAPGERRWLFGYGIAAGIYRLFITFTIAMFVASKFFVLGIAMALWFVVMQMVLPSVKMVKRVVPVVVQQQRQRRFAAVCSAASLAVVLLLFVLPMPHSTQAQGIIQLGEEATVRSGANGFIASVFKRNGEWVNAGEPLFQLEDQGINARVKLAQARVAELQARHQSLLMADRNAASRVVEEMHAARAEYDDIMQQSRSLLVSSERAGRLSLPREQDLPGRFVKQGDVLAHVVALNAAKARVVVAQNDVDDVRRQTQRVDVRLYSEPGLTINSSIIAEVPLATDQLPSALLG
ncbi:MAG: HlyD family efflux transporter periplasmic adaptor subunit, partial [Gammaproteobacteria bacterium]|nr:HlyD family efflux transporter periplasmic adaptor subunit [Gammaproteobacteria bacterium]